VGTRQGFSNKEFGRDIVSKDFNKFPKIMETGHDEPHDKTATIVIFTLIFATVMLAAGIGIFHNTCREKSLFVFWELDMRAITGGDTKRFVGGIIISFYILWVLIATIGFLVHYFAFNYRVDFAEVTNVNRN